jgi:hypothetical protein
MTDLDVKVAVLAEQVTETSKQVETVAAAHKTVSDLVIRHDERIGSQSRHIVAIWSTIGLVTGTIVVMMIRHLF